MGRVTNQHVRLPLSFATRRSQVQRPPATPLGRQPHTTTDCQCPQPRDLPRPVSVPIFGQRLAIFNPLGSRMIQALYEGNLRSGPQIFLDPIVKEQSGY